MESPIIEILDAMKTRMSDGGWPVTISCGVVTLRTPPGSPEDAVKATDQLMYEIKVNGKNVGREAVFERGHAELRDDAKGGRELPE